MNPAKPPISDPAKPPISDPAKPPISDPAKLSEAITAYLDGELDTASAREVEERLATDAPFREKVQRFQNSWELLDELPRTQADKDFAATTVEMVAVAEVRQSQGKNQNRAYDYGRMRRWTVTQRGSFLVMAAAVACLLGFLMTNGIAALLVSSGVIVDPDEQLLDDLPIIENLDKFLVADNVEFLRALNDHPQVASVRDAKIDEVKRTILEEPDSQRRARIETMSQQDENRLIINRRRFAELDPGQRDKWRQMYRQLLDDPQSEKLVQTMDVYYHWFLQQKPAERLEMRGQTSKQRLERMEGLLAVQQEKADATAVRNWLEGIAVRHRKLLAEHLQPPAKQRFARLSESIQRQSLAHMLWMRWDKGRNAKNPEIQDEDWRALQESLSPQLRQELAAASSPEAGLQMLAEKLPKTAGPRNGPRGMSVMAAEPMFALATDSATDANRDELWRFYYEDLTDQERKRLRRLPRQEFWRTLRTQYAEVHSRRPGKRRNGRPPAGHDRPPGHDRHGMPDHGKRPDGPHRPHRPGRPGDAPPDAKRPAERSR